VDGKSYRKEFCIEKNFLDDEVKKEGDKLQTFLNLFINSKL
jgi:hypothetical protein